MSGTEVADVFRSFVQGRSRGDAEAQAGLRMAYGTACAFGCGLNEASVRPLSLRIESLRGKDSRQEFWTIRDLRRLAAAEVA